MRCLLAHPWPAVLLLSLSSAAAAGQPATGSATSAKGGLSIDDVLTMERIDAASLEPDGEWAAVTIQRSASSGEIYGRTAYETDPSRNDVWLVSTRTGERRRVINGAAAAAGYWCASWSPNGQRLAMLSTQPEGGEPRGGDNVRLYVWDRATGKLTRMGDQAVMTQTRYGSPLYKLDLRGGADRGSLPRTCKNGDENAPFLWLDERRILAVGLPAGQISALLDQFSRSFRTAARDAERLREGKAVTAVAFGSGGARLPRDDASNHALLQIIDTSSGARRTITAVPTYPFRGALTVTVSPAGKTLAILAPVAALQPLAGKIMPNNWDDGWTVERKLGFVDVEAGAPIRWAALPQDARYPLELYDWSPDSRRVALRGRPDPTSAGAMLFNVRAMDGKAFRVGSGQVGSDPVRIYPTDDVSALWADNKHLLARIRDPNQSGRSEWWLLSTVRSGRRITIGDRAQPGSFRRDGDGRLIAICGGELVRLDVARAALVPVAKLGNSASIVFPLDPTVHARHLLVKVQSDVDGNGLRRVAAGTGLPLGPTRAFAGEFADADLASGRVLLSHSGRQGLFLRTIDLNSDARRDVLALNAHLSAVNWGETRLIDYEDGAGRPLKATVILPPGYLAGKRYPTLLWVYQGYEARELEGDYFLDPFAPGIYNLHLYAALGYVMLVPSMPLPPKPQRNDVYGLIPKPVLSAADRLISLGITDPDRMGVFGQSRGGYTVFSLITQTDRFKAGVALAGVSDLSTFYREFDPAAYGYPGIGHEKSDNWAQVDQFGRHRPPSGDPVGYIDNSPLSHVDRVTTPVMIVHGEADVRGTVTQAEQFFYALYDQGKTARFVRYGGETHSLAQSPANIRDIFDQTITWFDRNLGIDRNAQDARIP